MSVPATTTLDLDRLPPRRARWFVRSTLLRWGMDHLCADAELLVDELVANAMQHSRGRGVDVTLRAVGDAALRIEVGDPDPHFEIDFRGPSAPSRFGLRIVDSLSSRWGIESAPIGKVVWCELDGGVVVPFRASART